jgi:hypothetical protein
MINEKALPQSCDRAFAFSQVAILQGLHYIKFSNARTAL